jgi:hypothetical protein
VIKKIRVGGMTQVIEHLPSKGKAPSSNPSTTKKEFRKIIKLEFIK